MLDDPDINRSVVLLRSHETEPPRLLQDASESSEHFIDARGRVGFDQFRSNRLSVLVAEILPSQRPGVCLAGRDEFRDDTKSLPHRPPRTGTERGKIDGGGMAVCWKSFETTKSVSFSCGY